MRTILVLTAILVFGFGAAGCVGDITQSQQVGDSLPDTHENITESCGTSVNNSGCHPE